MKKALLLILDGYGYSKKKEHNAILQAKAPFLHSLFKDYPFSLLKADGKAVGLPEGVMGNSEVGHITIGAGRVIDQDLSRITKEIKDGRLKDKEAINSIKDSRRIHIMGLLSDGGVHSHEEHLYGLLDFFHKENHETLVSIHVITDGRDTPPDSGKGYVKKLEDYLKDKKNMEITSLSGRFYAMDRDKRWERIEKAYRAMTKEKEDFSSASKALEKAYQEEQTDEFIEPLKIGSATMQPEDAFIFFNFRSDRAREISLALTDPNFENFQREILISPQKYLTFSAYSEDFSFPVLFPKESPKEILGEIISGKGLKQLRIAETEKYAHVTYFFNGGREEVFPQEKRILVDSPRDVKTYDEKPEMSAFEVSEKLKAEITKAEASLIVCNYANGDMVGHTGNEKAAIQAIEALDQCIQPVVKEALSQGYEIYLTADHGNCEEMYNEESGQAFTQHSMNPVPFIHISKKPDFLNDGSLADIAPTILQKMDIQKPDIMTGKSLIKSN